MKAPLAKAKLKLSSCIPEVKELLDPEDPSDHVLRMRSGERKQLVDEYRKLEANLEGLREEMARISDTIHAIVPRMEKQVLRLSALGINKAQDWADALPIPEMIR